MAMAAPSFSATALRGPPSSSPGSGCRLPVRPRPRIPRPPIRSQAQCHYPDRRVVRPGQSSSCGVEFALISFSPPLTVERSTATNAPATRSVKRGCHRIELLPCGALATPLAASCSTSTQAPRSWCGARRLGRTARNRDQPSRRAAGHPPIPSCRSGPCPTTPSCGVPGAADPRPPPASGSPPNPPQR